MPGATWQTAAWFVANADRLGLETVSYDGKTWTRAKGWTDDPATTGAVATSRDERRDVGVVAARASRQPRAGEARVGRPEPAAGG